MNYNNNTAERRPVSFDPTYKVDEYGRIYKNGNTITQHRNTRGYDYVFLGNMCKTVSHCVAIAFVSNPNNYKYVDHIDRNKQNNHYSNLRWATSQHNNRNRSKCRNIKRVCTSKYKGVRRRGMRWQARIMVNKDTRKEISLGNFDTEREAAIAYNKGAMKYFGEHAVWNVID